MTREDKDSLVEMLAKIPVTETKGSLLSAIGKLLRVIDVSENSIMIPTLLKDKCEFDAYEMLTLAKILKASILGHNDLVEFYMSESSSQFSNTSLAHHQQQLSLCSSSRSSSGSSNGGNSNNGNSNSNSNNHHHHNHHHVNGRQQQHHFNHLSPIHQQSATPSLRSSASESTSSSQPSTPIPTHAESLGSSNGAIMSHGQHLPWSATMGQNGDPDATVRLLLHIEQLKVFIPQVTGIFESIIELYKNSVDTITYKNHSHN